MTQFKVGDVVECVACGRDANGEPEFIVNGRGSLPLCETCWDYKHVKFKQDEWEGATQQIIADRIRLVSRAGEQPEAGKAHDCACGNGTHASAGYGRCSYCGALPPETGKAEQPRPEPPKPVEPKCACGASLKTNKLTAAGTCYDCALSGVMARHVGMLLSRPSAFPSVPEVSSLGMRHPASFWSGRNAGRRRL